LSKIGYTVRRVESNYSESTDVKSEVISHSSYLLEIDSLGFKALLPGNPQHVESVDEEYNFKYIYREYGQGNTYEIEFYSIPDNATLLSFLKIILHLPKNLKFKNST